MEIQRSFFIKILILNGVKTNLILILIDFNEFNLRDFIIILRTVTGTVKENPYQEIIEPEPRIGTGTVPSYSLNSMLFFFQGGF